MVPGPVVTPVPGAPAVLVGVFNLRGEVVPLFDTAALLGLSPGDAGRHVAVADTSEGPAGLTAHAMPLRVELGPPAGPAERPGAIGRYAVDGGVATLLDVEHLIVRAARGGR